MCMLTPFLKYVSEGRVIRRHSDLQRYSFPEITEKIYISLLALAFIRHHDKNFVKMYSDNAVQKIISSPKLFISRRGHPIDLLDLYC